MGRRHCRRTHDEYRRRGTSNTSFARKGASLASFALSPIPIVLAVFLIAAAYQVFFGTTSMRTLAEAVVTSPSYFFGDTSEERVEHEYRNAQPQTEHEAQITTSDRGAKSSAPHEDTHLESQSKFNIQEGARTRESYTDKTTAQAARSKEQGEAVRAPSQRFQSPSAESDGDKSEEDSGPNGRARRRRSFGARGGISSHNTEEQSTSTIAPGVRYGVLGHYSSGFMTEEEREEVRRQYRAAYVRSKAASDTGSESTPGLAKAAKESGGEDEGEGGGGGGGGDGTGGKGESYGEKDGSSNSGDDGSSDGGASARRKSRSASARRQARLKTIHASELGKPKGARTAGRVSEYLGSRLADGSSVVRGQNVTRLSYAVYKIVRLFNLRRLVDYPSGSHVEWMPGMVSRLEFDVPGFSYAGVDMSEEGVAATRVAGGSYGAAEFVQGDVERALPVSDADMLLVWPELDGERTDPRSRDYAAFIMGVIRAAKSARARYIIFGQFPRLRGMVPIYAKGRWRFIGKEREDPFLFNEHVRGVVPMDSGNNGYYLHLTLFSLRSFDSDEF